jgi:hypothetical protein
LDEVGKCMKETLAEEVERKTCLEIAPLTTARVQ